MQRLVLTPTAQHVGNRGKRILVNDRRPTAPWFQIQHEHPRHDQCPKTVGKDEGVRVRKVFSNITRITSREHAFLFRERYGSE